MSKGNSIIASESQMTHFLSKSLLWVMAIGCGASVANLYYCQPLLADMAQTFHVSAGQIGNISMLTQLGYALGLFLFVPLGDMRERRRLIVIMLFAVTVSLTGMAIAQNMVLLGLFSFAVGATTVVPQMIISLAVQLSDPKKQGKAVGTVMSGLLFGILMARTFSGLVGDMFGWRIVYLIAAALMLLLAFILRYSLPESYPTSSLTYLQLFRSLWELIRQQLVLREAAFMGAMMFGSFSCFWTTLVFFLRQPPYHYGTQVAGLFGLVGVVGASISPVAGRLADKKNPHLVAGMAAIIIILSFVCFWLFGHWIWGLIIGVILLDLGVASAQIANQTRIYSLVPGAKNRLNTVYMVTAYIGASLGSLLGTYAWSIWRWNGVCLVGGTMALLSVFVWSIKHFSLRAI
ncbi:MAG: MFS transporter permease [Desulfosporosinus sp. BRH_c37]|nr:MAG: MFS transporter permease [Desulfosporosinus sp. BRH_c37]